MGLLFRSIASSDVSLEKYETMLADFSLEQNIVDGFGFPAISCAAMHGNDIAIAALLQHGVDPSTRDPNSFTPLMIALRGHGVGFKRSVNALIDATVASASDSDGSRKNALDLTDNNGMSAVHFAARAGECEAIDRLKELGADVHRKDGKKRTPLHYAALKARFRAVQSLLDAGAKVDIADGEGNTPALLCALELAHVQEAAFRRRLSSVGDVSPPASLGSSSDDKREEDWRRSVVELLVAAGADERRTNNCGQSIQQLSKKQRWLRVALGTEPEDSSSQDSSEGGGTTMRQRSRTVSLTVPNLKNRKKRSKERTAAIEEVKATANVRTDTPPMRESPLEDEAFEANGTAAQTKEEEEEAAELAKKTGKITFADIKRIVLMILLFGAARYAAFLIVGWWHS